VGKALADSVIATGVGLIDPKMWDREADWVERVMGGGVSHFSKVAAQREEEEELRASRLSVFGTDVSFSYFFFLFHFYCSTLLLFYRMYVLFNQWGRIPRMGATRR
jgi:hypothetical protein